jgi:mannose/cellobiose epimerase-like protein (N-acyl-D-glucosamine 2-epimerase family)
MVQARQVFVFAHAANLDWLPEGAALAETAMDSLLRRYRDRPAGIGGFAFSVDADGAIVDGIVKANKYRPFSASKLAERGGSS